MAPYGSASRVALSADGWYARCMSEPRNVTPDGPPETGDTSSSAEGGFGGFRGRFYSERSQEPEWMAWKWASRGRGFPWLGVLLVLLGVGLLAQFLVPTLSLGTLVLLAVGLAFVGGWLFGGSWFSLVPGSIFTSLGVAELIEDLALLGPAGQDVPGLASSALAIGFFLVWLVGYLRGRRHSWPLWGAAIFGVIGFAQLSGRIVGLPELGVLWPLLIIAIGLLMMVGARRNWDGRPRG